MRLRRERREAEHLGVTAQLDAILRDERPEPPASAEQLRLF